MNSRNTTSRQRTERQSSIRYKTRSIALFFAKAAFLCVAWILLSRFVFGFHGVSGQSMKPYASDGDLVAYIRIGADYRIGDMVAYRKNGREFLGRLVAQGGDEVGFDGEGGLIINGSLQDDGGYPPTYASDASACSVPYGSWYILCDNRTEGIDSRDLGPVADWELLGRAFLLIRTGNL